MSEHKNYRRFWPVRILYRILLSLLTLATLLCVGCGSGNSKTQVRALQASPDETTTLNVLLDSTTLFTGIALGTPTSYSSVASGAHQLVVEPSNSSTAAINQAITLSTGTNYTLITAGYAASLVPMLLTDDTTTPSSGDFNIRIVNAAVEAGSVDIYILPPGSADPSTGTVAPTISGLTFTSSSSYQSLTAGTYEIVVSPAGFPVEQYINTGSTLNFAAGQNRSFIILPNGKGGISSVTLSDLN